MLMDDYKVEIRRNTCEWLWPWTVSVESPGYPYRGERVISMAWTRNGAERKARAIIRRLKKKEPVRYSYKVPRDS